MSSIAKRGGFSIRHLPDCLRANHKTPVVVYSRVSESSQVSNGSLAKQKQRMLAFRTPEILNRWFSDPLKGDAVDLPKEASIVLKGTVDCQEEAIHGNRRPELERAAAIAKKRKAILLAHDATRLLHPKRFHVHENPIAELTPYDLRHLEGLVGGVTVATLIPPNTPYDELKSISIRLGQIASEKKPGRPTKTDLKLLAAIIHLADCVDKNARFADRPAGRNWIAEQVSKRMKRKVSPSQVQRYLNKEIPERDDGARWEDFRQNYFSAYPVFRRLREEGAFDTANYSGSEN